MKSHPTEFDLERLFAGELSDEAATQVRAHADGCETCSAYLEELARESESLLSRKPPMDFVRDLEARMEPAVRGADPFPLGRLYRIVPLAAAAAFIIGLAVALWPAPRPSEGTRWMGASPGVRLHVDRGGQVISLGDSQPRAGDRFRYEIIVPDGRRAYAAVIAIEAKSVFPLIPADPGAEPVTLRGTRLLPGSVAVDPDGEPSTVLLFLREEPFVIADLIAEVSEANRLSGDLSEIGGLVHETVVNPDSK